MESLLAVTEISVAFLGPAYTYSHLAAQLVQPDSALLLPCDTIDQVFAAIESRQARCGLVPMFNTSSGLVSDSVVAIVRRLVRHMEPEELALPEAALELDPEDWRCPTSQLCISESIDVAIQHCLVSWGSLSSVREVSSKQQALEQCRRWLDQHLSGAARIAKESSATALLDLRHHPEQAAIVSRAAAAALAAPLCLEDIQDQTENSTEFVVVQLDSERKPVLPVRRDWATNECFEYLISEVSGTGPESDSSNHLVNETRGGWSGRLFWEGVWYEASKRPLTQRLGQDQPWTGEISPAASSSSAKAGPVRTWRLGIG